MHGFLVLIIVTLIVGMIYLSWKPAAKPKSRRDFLADLAQYLDGTLSPMEGAQDGYQVKFNYDGQEFVYEEIETVGFKQSTYKGFLKTQSSVPFTFYLTERKAQRIVRPGFEDAQTFKDKPVNVPESLHVFWGNTNDTPFATEFLKDPQIEPILRAYKSLDMNGYPFMSLKIMNGELVLEFNSLGRVSPDLNQLRAEVPSIEKHLDRMMALLKRIEEVQNQRWNKL